MSEKLFREFEYNKLYHQTEHAYFVNIKGTDKRIWIPKKISILYPKNKKIQIEEWFCVKEDLKGGEQV